VGRCLLAVTLGGLLTGAHVTANAAPLDSTGASQCRTRGYSTDIDPAGTTVRSAPRADAPVIGRLAPPTLLGPGTYEGVEFEVVGSKDGWLLIQKPAPESGLKLDAGNAADGRGWISGRLVAVVLGDRSLRAAPRREAPVVADLSGPGIGPDSFIVSTVHACDGKYLEVTGTWHGKPLRGWSLSPCSNQLTTCDGGSASD
jgi:hypothetical protein